MSTIALSLEYVFVYNWRNRTLVISSYHVTKFNHFKGLELVLRSGLVMGRVVLARYYEN